MSSNSAKVSIIIVTHNSELFMENLLKNIDYNCDVIIVDSGSTSTDYLYKVKKEYCFRLIELENVGFAKANNIGYRTVDDSTDFVVFVNPDLFLSKGWLQHAIDFMSQSDNQDVAVFSSALERYDINSNCSQGVYDSLGIGRKIFWYDIGQGESIKAYDSKRSIVEREAICGALMFCRKKSLDEVSVGGEVFWEKLFMYKEDIELSLRLRKKKYRLCIDVNSVNFHCRGWKDRKTVPKWAKLISARNDLLISWKYNLYSLPVFFIKYLYVKLIEK